MGGNSARRLPAFLRTACLFIVQFGVLGFFIFAVLFIAIFVRVPFGIFESGPQLSVLAVWIQFIGWLLARLVAKFRQFRKFIIGEFGQFGELGIEFIVSRVPAPGPWVPT